jgi:hypothetical protein
MLIAIYMILLEHPQRSNLSDGEHCFLLADGLGDNRMYAFYVRRYSDLTSSRSHHKWCERIQDGMRRHDHANRWLITFASSFVGSVTVRAYTSV